MKKYVAFLTGLLLFLIPAGVFAQNESFLGLSFGAAFPQGEFAENDFYNSESGYANTGFLFTFDGALFPDDYLGIGASITYASNNPDKTKYKEDLISDVLARYPNMEELVENFIFDFGVWRYLNFHAGPNFTVAAGYFNFDLRALAGLSMAWAPNLDLQINAQGEEVFSRKVTPDPAATLGFTVGGGVRYALKSGYVFRINSDYTNCKPTIEVKENVIESYRTGEEAGTRKTEKPIKNIQVGIGIAYNFKL